MKTQILLVDDNPIQAEARSAILSRSGSIVVVTHSAAEALKILADPSAQAMIGLVVTDHLMPGMNGPELVRETLALVPAMPILVLSGLPDAESEYEPGQIVFRLKPFPPNELIRLAKHMLGDQALRSA